MASGFTSQVQAVQGIPYQINFQGRLGDATGAALADGSYNIKFRIWDSLTAGTNLWSQDNIMTGTDNRITVTNGLFSVQLGSLAGQPLPASVFSTSSTRYLEIELPSVATNTCGTNGCASFTEGPFTPRQPLASSPYAYNSDTLDGLDSAAFAQTATTNTFADTNTFSKSGGAGIVLSGTPASGGSLLQMGSALASGNSSGTLIGANTALSGDLVNLQVSGATKLKVDNSGNLTLASGTSITIGAAAGTGTTCSGGQFLQNQTTVGGIVTGGTCATPSGTGASVTLNNLGTTSINADLLPSANNTRSIGSTGLVWANLYATTIDAGTTSTTLTVGSAATTTALTLGRAGLQVSIPGGLSSSGTLTTSGNISTTGSGNITAAGNLIVGSTNSERVTVSGTGRQYIQVTTSTAGAEVGLNYTNTAGSVLTGLAGTAGQILDSGAANDYIFNNRTGGILFSADSAHNRKDIYVAASTGNVGIGSGTTGYKLDVAGDVNTSGVYRVAGTAGASTTCSGGQILLDPVTSGGITTGGTCTAANSVGTLQNVYDNSSTPAGLTLATGKNLVVTSPELATDPNIVFNLQCATCSAGGGQLSVQDNGTDIFTALPTGQIIVAPTAGQNFSISQAGTSGTRITATSVPTVDQMSIDNTSTTGVTTAGVNGLNINYKGGAAAVESGGMRVDLTPGTTSGGSWNGMRVVANATGAVSGVAENGLKLDGPTSPGAGTETAIYIGTGWDNGLDIQSGAINIAGFTSGANPSDPTAPAAGNFKVYAKKTAGRMMLKGIGPSGVNFTYQPSLFEQAISYESPLTGATVSNIGQSWAITATATTPASTETFGTSTNFATTAVANNATGVAEALTGHFRGSTANSANGFFYVARLGLPDASYGAGATGSRIWTGLTSNTNVAMVASDSPTGDFAGFMYSTNRGDATWQFITKDNTTLGGPTAATGITFAQNKVYDFYIYVAPQGSTIYWRVDNLTDGQTAEGNTATNLPRTTIGMRGGSALQTLTTTARNIRVLKHYIESDR